MAVIKVLDPTAQRIEDNAHPGPDAGVLAGKRVGFRLDQIWRCWDWISEDWERKLRAAGAEVSYWRSTNRSGQEGEEQNRSLQEWLKTIDIAVVGLANCGSCTGWTIRDAIAAANAGLPTTAVATKNFEDSRMCWLHAAADLDCVCMCCLIRSMNCRERKLNPSRRRISKVC